jgi:hypothetical protein
MTATLKLSSEMPSIDNVSLATVSPRDIIYVHSHVIGWKVIVETSYSVPVKTPKIQLALLKMFLKSIKSKKTGAIKTFQCYCHDILGEYVVKLLDFCADLDGRMR